MSWMKHSWSLGWRWRLLLMSMPLPFWSLSNLHPKQRLCGSSTLPQGVSSSRAVLCSSWRCCKISVYPQGESSERRGCSRCWDRWSGSLSCACEACFAAT